MSATTTGIAAKATTAARTVLRRRELTVSDGMSSRRILDTVSRSKQLAYAGHPLYYFAGDDKAGQARGEALTEFGAKWYALNSAGNAVVPAPTASTNGNNAGGGSYGY